MSTVTVPQTGAEPTVDGFAERLFGAVLGAQEVQAVYLGHRLGWYRALADHGSLTSVELADRTGTTERYAREWLEHQAVCGYLTVDLVDAAPTERRYTLPAAHAEVLVDEDSLAYVAPLARFVATVGQHLDHVAEAYRTGGGVSWAELGTDAREAQAEANRPLFLHQLGQELLPQVPDLHARLEAGARVADVGCGGGWSSIGLARAYPGVTVDGFDIDAPSIEMARRNAEAAGLTDRVRFHAEDGAEVEGHYDGVFAFECIHDLPDPVSVLAAMRRLAGPDGIVIVMDERVGEHFTAPGDELDRLMYGYSITACLPDGMAHRPSEGTGTVMRPSTLADYARRAGFARADVLPIENDFFRFYRLEV
ncbi:MAG: class I SAM-dependent methyltransferase [Acidimicrobiia bacterium]|nr:class I SAM-dependent methyltransferase [Acidimicrobiia bacterium]